MGWWALASVAGAHPMGSTVATQTTVVVVEHDAVDVTYTAEVPDDVLRPSASGLDPHAAMAVELGTGLVLQVDDHVVHMVSVDDAPAPAPGSRHTTTFVQHLRADLPADPHRIRVSTANLLELRNVYAAEVKLEPVWRVASCSLLTTRDGKVVRDGSLRLQPEEEARSVEVVLDGREPRLVATLLGRGGEPVRAGKLLARTGLARFAPPTMDAIGLALATLAAAGAGLATRTLGRAHVGLALGLLGVLAPLARLPGTTELVLGGTALLSAALAPPPVALGLALAGLGATTGAWPAAGLVLLAGLAAAAVGRGSARTERAAAAVVALAVLGRGALWLSA
ncbi:MAG: hypothetical protein H6738_05350 [Alphaproteobacteria bacterium]|nr:hypothetical protein [Alphaproteobacteria bacterium]MCB9696193.1 hypothetical protein [Alphaproteobacteria bacterium]